MSESEYNIEVPDVVIREKGIIHKIPPSFEYDEVFQRTDKLYHELIASGNMTRKMRRMTNLPLKNPYYLIRGQLLDHELADSPREHNSSTPVQKKKGGVRDGDIISRASKMETENIKVEKLDTF